jgi:hypothetical protein
VKIDGHCHCGEITFEAEVDPNALTICHWHRLPNAHRLGVSREHSRSGRAFCAPRYAEKLYEDGRKRQQTPPRLLRELRHADLCLCGRQPAGLRAAGRDDHPAHGLQAAAARLAQVRARLGRRARRRAGHREKLELTNQTLVRVASGIGVALRPSLWAAPPRALPGEDRG